MSDKVVDEFSIRIVGIFLAGLLAVLLLMMLGVGLYYFVPSIFEPRRPSDQMNASTPTGMSAWGRKMLREQIAAPEAQVAQSFKGTGLPDPASLCRSFAPASQPDALWHQSTWNPSQWECFASFGPQVVTSEARGAPALGEAYQVFIILRGTSLRLDSLRMKLSLHDESSRTTGFAHFRVVYDTVISKLGLNLPPVFQNAVGENDWSQFVQNDYVVTWSKEYGEPPRYDLSIQFATNRGKFLALAGKPPPVPNKQMPPR